MPLTVPLREAADVGVSLVGGKAENLGRLLRAGLPVPGGFVVTTEAFRAHTDDPAIRERIDVLDRLRRGEAGPGVVEVLEGEGGGGEG